MMNVSGEIDERSDNEDGSDDDDDDKDVASVESYKYSAEKLMMCGVRKILVCHDYRYTSGEDSEGGAKAHDPTLSVKNTAICARGV
jgi:hypothetical protein